MRGGSGVAFTFRMGSILNLIAGPPSNNKVFIQDVIIEDNDQYNNSQYCFDLSSTLHGLNRCRSYD